MTWHRPRLSLLRASTYAHVPPVCPGTPLPHTSLKKPAGTTSAYYGTVRPAVLCVCVCVPEVRVVAYPPESISEKKCPVPPEAK